MGAVLIDDLELPLGCAEFLVPGADPKLLTSSTLVYHCETALSPLADPRAYLVPPVHKMARHAQIELIDRLSKTMGANMT